MSLGYSSNQIEKEHTRKIEEKKREIELTKDTRFGSCSKDKISTMRHFDDVHMDGVVWKDRLWSRLQNHNSFIVDGTQFKDRGKKSKGQIRGTRGARRPSDWVKATRGRTMPYEKTQTAASLKRLLLPSWDAKTTAKKSTKWK